MTSIDKRIVEMNFDNRQFEDGVSTSIRSLDNLKKGLNLDASTRSLTGLASAGRSFNLENIAQGVESIAGRFSTLGIIGMSVLQNLTNSAIVLGQRLVNAIAIAPIRQGLAEYETQLNAIQTTLANTASKGTTLEDVNKALDELNTYADKTIYNFSEMTRNIGTFTAAGISLDTSVSAIKGIANLAAVSGSNSQQASVAMYQLSQALSSGTVRLMDWNSVVNAGMGGQVFQDALKETARLHKVNIDAMIKKEGSFRETLQKGWLTSEILTETLSKFTGDLNAEQLKTMGYTEDQIAGILKLGNTANDAATKVKTFTQFQQTLAEAIQSGWAKSWQIIIGDFNEAKTFWTNINDVFGAIIAKTSDSRNNLLQGWKDLGGRHALIDALTNSINGVVHVVTLLKDAFIEILPPITARKLADLSIQLRAISLHFKMGEEASAKLKKTFKGVAAILDIFLMAISALGRGFSRLIDAIAPSGDSILNFSSSIADYILGIRDAIKTNDTFNKAIDKIFTFVANSTTIVKGYIAVLTPYFERIKTFLTDTFNNIDLSGVDTFIDKFKIRFEPLTKLFEFVGKIFIWFGKVIKEISPFFFNVGKVIGRAFNQFSKQIMAGMLNLDFTKTFDSLNAGLIGALILSFKSFVDKGKSVFGGISDILDQVRSSIEVWQTSIKAKTLLTIAIALGILAISLISIAMIDSEKLSAALVAITVMLTQLVGTMALMEKIPGGSNLAKSAAGLIALSFTILIISAAVKTLSDLEPQEITKGLIGLTAIMTELALFMEVTNKTKFGGGKGLGILFLAASLLVLATAVEKFGNIDPSALQQGLLGVGAILTELALFVTATGDSKKVISTAIGLTILAAAMLIFGVAIEKMGNMSWEVLGKGLGAMASSLLIVASAIRLMPKNMLGIALSLVLISGSMLVMANALSIMGGMSWEQLAKGLGSLATTMLILALGLNAMRGTIGSAVAILIVAGALMLLAPALKQLGNMSLKEIGLSLLSLAGIFLVIGLAGLILTPLIPTLVALSGSMLLFGLACTAVGGGILAFSSGLSALAVAGVAGTTALITIITMLVGLIPMIAVRLAEGIISFAQTIAEGAPIIGAALLAVLQTLLTVIISIVPQLAVTIVYLVFTILDTLAKNLPKIIQAGFDIILGFLKGIRDNIAEVVIVVGEIITEFLDAIALEIPKVIQSGWDLILSFINGLSTSVDENSKALGEAVGKLASAIITGLANGILAGGKVVVDAVIGLAKQALAVFGITIDANSPSKEFQKLGGYIPWGVAVGINQFSGKVTTAVSNLANDAISSMGNLATTISDTLSSQMDMSPSIRPVIDLTDVKNGANAINGLLSETPLSMLETSKRLNGITASMQPANMEVSEINKPTQTPVISLVQNNYSPAELSKLEIYRQTRNQLLMLKGLTINP